MSDLENKAQEFAGKAKEGVGEAAGNEDLANEGRADQVKADVKQAVSDAGETIKDAAKGAGDALKGAADKALGAFKKD